MKINIKGRIIEDLLYNKTLKNGIWLYALQFFNTVIPLLTLPYITRVLGSSQYGVFSIALNVVGYMQVIVEYGFAMSATRKVAISDSIDLSKLFTNVVASRFLLFSACAVSSLFISLFIIKNDIQRFSLLILSLSLLGNCIQLNWLFQGKQEMKYISIIGVISRSISVILIFLFVKTKYDILLYCLLYSIFPILNGVFGIAIAKRKYGIGLCKVSFADIKAELKSGWYIFTTNISSAVFGSIGVTLLGVLATATEVGVYAAIHKIPNILLLLWAPISQVLYPISSIRIRNSYIEGRRFLKKIQIVTIIVFSIIAFTISLFAKTIVSLAFGAEYVTHCFWVVPLMVWLVISINNNFYGIQILLGSGHDKEYSKCFQISVVCTVLINFILIVFWKGIGASIAPLISEIILFILLHREVRILDRSICKDICNQ